jgi:antitoxin PrlF
MITATVSSKGQIAIPKALRDRLNLKAGTQLLIDVDGEKLVMRRVVKKYPDWRTMEGLAKRPGSLTKALEDERAAERARDDAGFRQHR